MTNPIRIRLSVFVFTTVVYLAAARGADELARHEWQVDGVAREALVYVPTAAKTTASPVVFAFHGHGGTMRHAATTFAYHKHWPEAIVVYMQGLKTPGQLTDPKGKKTGWQSKAKDQSDRDLQFFDAVLESLKQDYKVDERRIYSTGHSNGGGFTYLLWAARGDVFAAVAPSAAVGARQLKDLKPKPVLHVAGENDELVKFEWQKLMIDQLLKLNGCDKGTPHGKWCTQYASQTGTPVVTMIHPGTHKFPEEAPPVIVKFFQSHTKQ
jgi:polyhydroxybutyrate depolymerase